MSRPTGVTILGILGIIGGAFAILLAAFLMLGSAFIARRALGLPGMLIGMGGTMLAVLAGGVGALYLVAGIGLLNLQNWARLLAIVLAGISLFFSGLAVLGGLSHFFIFLAFRRLFVVAIDVLVIWYLSQPDIKQAFLPKAPAAIGP